MLDTLKLAGLVPVIKVKRAKMRFRCAARSRRAAYRWRKSPFAQTRRRKRFAACTRNCLK